MTNDIMAHASQENFLHESTALCAHNRQVRFAFPYQPSDLFVRDAITNFNINKGRPLFQKSLFQFLKTRFEVRIHYCFILDVDQGYLLSAVGCQRLHISEHAVSQLRQKAFNPPRQRTTSKDAGERSVATIIRLNIMLLLEDCFDQQETRKLSGWLS